MNREKSFDLRLDVHIQKMHITCIFMCHFFVNTKNKEMISAANAKLPLINIQNKFKKSCCILITIKYNTNENDYYLGSY